MSELQVVSEVLIEALTEANELLQDEVTRHRRTIQYLRVINSNLRKKLAIAAQNDEAFKEFALSGITTDDTSD